MIKSIFIGISGVFFIAFLVLGFLFFDRRYTNKGSENFRKICIICFIVYIFTFGVGLFL